MRIYIKNKNNFGDFLILIFAIIFLILSIVLSIVYGIDALMLIILAIYGMVILIKNTFGIKFDRSEGKDKNGKKKKK